MPFIPKYLKENKMGLISFLDCTLRDGGYINDWRFGNLTIRSVISRLDAAGVDYIEVGFLDSRQKYDNERSMFPDIPSITKTLGSVKPKNAKLVAMIDYGTFDESLLVPSEDSPLYGIRLIFTKDRITPALEYAKKIKAQGYQLFLNLVSTSSYSDKELLSLVDKINEVGPKGVSIVDTYGLMFGSDMSGYAMLLDRNLNHEIALGYHSHNNLQMSNANTIEFLKLHFSRDVIVDSSVLGMGKNAGNACTELMLSYANNEGIRSFDIAQVLECAHIDIGKFQNTAKWGYRLDFLMSAILRCSPNWTKLYMKDKTLSIRDICGILSKLPGDRKYLPSYFSPELAAKLREEYINKNVDDCAACENLAREIGERNVLLICPGATLQSHRQIIEEYISQYNPFVVSINFLRADLKADCVWISNAVRYSQASSLYGDMQERPKIILTSNITPLPDMAGDMVFNFKSLSDKVGGDISAVLILELLLSLGIQNITFAGFDGYEDKQENFFDSGLLLSAENQSNERIATQLRMVEEQHDCSHVKFITPSKFETIFCKRYQE